MTAQDTEPTTLANTISGTVALTFDLPADDTYLPADTPIPDDLLQESVHIVKTGSVIAYAGNSAPAGWLLCAGQELDQATYDALFQVIGITYSPATVTTTFHLPDLRGRFALGLDNMGSTSADRVAAAAADELGGSGGAETHTLTLDEMPAHSHDFRRVADTNPGRGSVTQTARGWVANDTLVEAAGGGQAHDNMPPYQALNYIIKT